MIKIPLQLLLVMTLGLGGTASAKCPTGSVTVHGRVENLQSGAEVVVVLVTPKGNVSKTAPISGGEFTAEVSFLTWSSSFLGGDRCHNAPTVVEVKVEAGGRIYVQKRIQFKDNFEMYSPLLYRLKQDLIIDVLKENGRGGWHSP
jgi:hypothetical protein